MELTAGAILAAHVKAGDRAVILHLTLGERGHPKLAADVYGRQKRKEAAAAAKLLGAEVIFGPYRDAYLPDEEPVRNYITRMIREIRPAHVITHARESIHPDHANTHAAVKNAVLRAPVEGYPGVRGLYYAENWEDARGFEPYLLVDVTGVFEQWREAVSQYEFVRGGVVAFPYLDYYASLARVRGALAGCRYAEALDIEAAGKKRVLQRLP